MKKWLGGFLSAVALFAGLFINGAIPAAAAGNCAGIWWGTAPLVITSGSSGTYSVTASSSNGCSSPRFKWYLGIPGYNGTTQVYWYLARDWSSSGSYVWNTTGAAKGDYAFKVQIKNSDSTNAFDSEWVQDLNNDGTGTTTAVAWASGTYVPSPQFTFDNYGTPGVLHNPSVALIFWGSAWSTGWSDGNPGSFSYGSTTYKNYLTQLFHSMGGLSWDVSVGRNYCDNIPANSTSCAHTGASFVGYGTTSEGPHSLIYGTWIDTASNPPSTTYDTDLRGEVTRAITTGGLGYNANTLYYVVLPSGVAFGNGSGYHSMYDYQIGSPTAYVSLGAYSTWINTSSSGIDSLGNKYYDGVGVVALHEFAEGATDPGAELGVKDGWERAVSVNSEIADECMSVGKYYQITSNPANTGASGAWTFFQTQATQLNGVGCNSW